MTKTVTYKCNFCKGDFSRSTVWAILYKEDGPLNRKIALLGQSDGSFDNYDFHICSNCRTLLYDAIKNKINP